MNDLTVVVFIAAFVAVRALECKRPGWTCLDCSTQVLCLGHPGGSVTQLTSVHCDVGETCILGKGCTELEDPACRFRKFECHDDGQFPDPYDCQKYHRCVGREGMEFTCPAGTIFNVAEGKCVSSSQPCRQVIPLCVKDLQSEAVDGDPRMFYICERKGTTLAPELYRCPPDFVYANYGCHRPATTTPTMKTTTA